MKNKYEKPSVQVVSFCCADEIADVTTSPSSPGIGGGGGGIFPGFDSPQNSSAYQNG